MTQDPDKLTLAIIIGLLFIIIVLATKYLDDKINKE